MLENASDREQKLQEERTKVKRRKRKAASPAVATKSSDESDNSSVDSPLHVKSKVARASSKAKNKFNLDDFFDEARYFVMKSNNHENVALSKAKVQ